MSRLTILAPVTGGDHDTTTLESAAVIAKTFDAHVTALFHAGSQVDSMPLIGEGMSASVVKQIYEAASAETDRRRQAAQQLTLQTFETFGILLREAPPAPAGASGTFIAPAGPAEGVLLTAAQLADLTVIAQPHKSQDDTMYLQILESLMLAAGRPVFMAPAKPDRCARTVGIAWRGTGESARAVAMARPFLDTAEHVFVYTVGTDKTGAQRAQDLTEHFAWCNIPATARPLTPNGSVGKTLSAAAAADGVEMLVMGAYGHSRVRELVLGGVTRHMVSNTTIPLLMSH